MGFSRFVGSSALAGVLVAVAVNSVTVVFENTASFWGYVIFSHVALILFPAGIGDIARTGTAHWDFYHFSMFAANGVVYAVIGAVTWLSMYKSKFFYVLDTLLICLIVLIAWLY